MPNKQICFPVFILCLLLKGDCKKQIGFTPGSKRSLAKIKSFLDTISDNKEKNNNNLQKATDK